MCGATLDVTHTLTRITEEVDVTHTSHLWKGKTIQSGTLMCVTSCIHFASYFLNSSHARIDIAALDPVAEQRSAEDSTAC
jgi:hypothetical protein